MIKKLLFLLFFITFCKVNAQCPDQNYLQLSTQEDVNNFDINYPNCEIIINDLIIGSSSGSDITDLSPLENIIAIGRDLTIQSTELVSLSGIENIINNSGSLFIRYNEKLTDITALSGLTSVNNLDISDNDLLASLQGLNNLQTVLGNLEITQHQSLINLTGLESLNKVGGTFMLRLGYALESLNGIENLEEVGYLSISLNDQLENIDALSNLNKTTNSGLFFWRNPKITSLQSLSNLYSIAGYLSIIENNGLTSLSGLDNIDPNTITGLQIMSSQSLSYCNVASVCGYIENNGANITISENTVGCNSSQQISSECNANESDCAKGDVILTTQIEVDAFKTNYPTCEVIRGNLYIGVDTGISNINNLQALKDISLVFGSLTISNTSLTNLYGLGGINETNGDFIIKNNSQLSTLSDITNLININGGQLILFNNDVLTNLTGLDNINPTSISHLVIEESVSLSDSNVESVCRYISAFGSTYSIANNALGSNSFDEVLSNCRSILPECPETTVLQYDSQAQIDHFVVQYPDCKELYAHVTIGGIYADDNDITDLTPFTNIEEVAGNLGFIELPELTSLQGFNNTRNVGGILSLFSANKVENMQGLDAITDVGQLSITSNQSLKSLEGLNNVILIGGDGLTVARNPNLETLSGLNNLYYITGVGCSVSITDNPKLINLEGLNSLQVVNQGIFTLKNNENLETTAGLNSLQSVSSVRISDNPNLISFESLQSLNRDDIDYGFIIQRNSKLSSLRGLHNIKNMFYISLAVNDELINLDGLDNLQNVSNQMFIGSNNKFQNFTGVNNLVSVDRLTVQANEILENFVGFNNLTSIRDLYINRTKNLKNFNGLESVENIDGITLELNEGLETLDGLNLNSFGANYPGSLKLLSNPKLISLESLSNVNPFNVGDLKIDDNDMLTSLSGLDGIDSSNITDFTISNSEQLSTCNVVSVCDYLSGDYGAFSYIELNTVGCNSIEEVLAECANLSIDEFNVEDELLVYSNPVIDVVNLKTKNSDRILWIKVYDINGKLVLFEVGNKSQLNLSHFPSGTYIITAKTSQGVLSNKIVKK